MSATTAAPVVTRETKPPRAKGESPEDMWGNNWADEGLGATSSRGRGRQSSPELPPVRTLAERRRKPSGSASHPVILVSGGDHSGKSYETALLTGDERIGPAYWLEVGRETTADWYGRVPGADYEIIGHDGTWRDMYTALEQAHAEAHQLVKADGYDGRPPMLAVDSMTGEWEHLSRWAESRAMQSRSNVEKLLSDPHADIDIGALLWNSANRRHKAWMQLILTWPGPVILIARGKMTMAVNEQTGNLDHKAPKVYQVNAQKDLPHEVLMHVRLDVTVPPEVLGYRHPTHGIGGRYGGKTVVIDPQTKRFAGVEFSLAWLLFDVIKYDPATAVVRVLNDPEPVADVDPGEQPRPVVRRLTPEEQQRLDEADEAPGRPVAETTEPQRTR